MRNWFILALSIMLLGCSANVKLLEPPKAVYPLPEALEPSGVKWYVITKKTMEGKNDSDVFIGMTYDDSISYRQWLELLKVYIEKQKAIICKHQPCEEIINVEP